MRVADAPDDENAGVAIIVAHPGEPIPPEVYEARWEWLRRPLGMPAGSERLADEGDAIHAWAREEGLIAAVGRAHLVDQGDGAGPDHTCGPAGSCPGFSPLAAPTAGFPPPEELRPAIQVRQMATDPQRRRRGLGAMVLGALLAAAAGCWGARTGWLASREEALAFYEACGWRAFGPWEEVAGIGPHRTMWRPL